MGKTIGSVNVQHYRIEAVDGPSVDLYFAVDEGSRLYQITWGYISWRFTSLVFKSASDLSELTTDFDFDGQMTSCVDGRTVYPPPRFSDGVQNIISKAGFWGTAKG